MNNGSNNDNHIQHWVGSGSGHIHNLNNQRVIGSDNHNQYFMNGGY